MGVGYALWSDSLYLEGTINTGELDICMISVADDDSSAQGIDPGYTKDVASTSATIIDCYTATVTVTNGYPSYENYVHFTTEVRGTVPVILEAIIVDNPNPLAIEVEAWNGVGEQRHPGDRADNTLWFHVLQAADQNATYSFSVEFYYVQYNESQFPP
jgi:hypothetical protein